MSLLRRYRVHFTTLDKVHREYFVLSWYGEAKAVAMATLRYKRECPDYAIFNVESENLGEPPLAHDRYPDDLIDRMEW